MLDRESFAAQAHALSAPLYRFARRQGSRPQDAMDVVQETLLRAFRGRAALRDPERLRGWVYGIARNVLLSERRRPAAARAATIFDEAGIPAREPDPRRAEDARALREAISALPGDLREVTLLHYYDALTYEEVAAALGLPRPTVQGRLRRAKEALRERLAGAFADERAGAQALRAALGLPGIPAVLADRLHAAIAEAPETPDALEAAEAATAPPPPAEDAAAIADGAASQPPLFTAVPLAGPVPVAPAVAVLSAVAAVALLIAWSRAPEAPAPAHVASASLAAASPAPVALATAPPVVEAGGVGLPGSTSAAAVGVAPGTPATPLAHALSALAAEVEREPPAYPYAWPVLPPPSPPTDLGERRATLDFHSASFAEIVEYLRRVGVPVEVDREAAESISRSRESVNLRLRDITLKNALELILSQLDTGRRRIVYRVEGRGIRVYLAPPPEDDAEDSPRAREARLRWKLVDRPKGGWPDPPWVASYRSILAQKRVSLDIVQGTIQDAVTALQQATGLNFIIAQGVDAAGPITVRLTDVPARDALVAVCRAARDDLTYVFDREAIVLTYADAVREPEPPEAPLLPSRPVSLAMTGGTVPEMVRALEAAGVAVVVSPETWASRGSLSAHLDGVPVSRVADAIDVQAPVSAEWVRLRDEPARAWLVLRGEVAGAVRPLAEEPPAGIEEGSARRARLADLVLRRAEARALARSAEGLAALFALERRVSEEAAALRSWLPRAREVAGARERQRAVAADLAAARRLAEERRPGAERAEKALQAATEGTERRAAELEFSVAATLHSDALFQIERLERALADTDRDTAILARLERGEALAAAEAAEPRQRSEEEDEREK